LRFVALSGDFKTDLRTNPLGSVLGEVEVVLQTKPNDFLVGDELYDPHLATMDVFEMIRKLATGFVGRTFDLFRLPSTNIVDGSEGFFRSLVHQHGGGVTLIAHDSASSLLVVILNC